MAQGSFDNKTVQIATFDTNGKVLAANQAWQRFAEENQTAGNPFSITLAQGLNAILSGETELFCLEYPHTEPESERWFCLRVTRLPGEGEVRMIATHEDITARKLAADALRVRVDELASMTQRLERKNQELDQFAYITSHDLRAPLRGIANLSRWIEEDIEGQLSEEVRGHLDLMRGRVHRMEGMIEGILAFARIGRTRIVAEKVDVAALLNEMVDLLDPPQGFMVDIQSPLPILVSERVPLQQVFLNLISNAIKHHQDPEQGLITVTGTEQGEFWEFRVTDNGPGIAPQYHDKVFVIFQTLLSRDKMENTGVGLALVKKMVEAEGGTIRLISEEGHGASFCFTWPKSPRRKELTDE